MYTNVGAVTFIHAAHCVAKKTEVLVFDHRTGVLALFVMALGCGETFSAATEGGSSEASGTTQASSGRTTEASTGGKGGSSSASAGGEGGHGGAGVGGSGPGGSGGDTGSGGSGGAPEDFFASCSGTVDCPGMLACADWEYTITDNGTTTIVTAHVASVDWGLDCSEQSQYATSDDLGEQVVGNIVFPCETTTWSFGTDKVTGLVYVKELTTGYSWTPPCK